MESSLRTPGVALATKDIDEKVIEITIRPEQNNLSIIPICNLKYLSVFSEKEVENFNLNKSPHELDELIEQYYKSYLYYFAKTLIACGSNCLYVIFQINTSNSGVKTFAQLFRPDIIVPDSIAYGIGAPGAVLDGLKYFFAVEYKKEALTSTLKYIKRKANTTSTLTHIRNHPLDTLESCLHWSILFATNLTGATSLVIDISNKMMSLPLPVYIGLVCIILEASVYYYKKYLNPDYYAGYKFWGDKRHILELFKPYLKGNISTSTQIIIQGASAVGLMTFPTYWYYAVGAKETFGWWLPVEAVAALTTWRNICVLFPYTYHFYKDNEEENYSLLAQQNNDAEIQQKYIQLRSAQPYFYVFRKESINIFTVSYRTVCSGILGFQAVSNILSSNPWVKAVGTISCASLGGGLLYRAEKNRLDEKLMKEQLTKNAIPKKESWSTTWVLTYLLCTASEITTYMATMGAVRLLGLDTPTISSLTAIIAGERFLNNFRFNSGKVYKALTGLFGSSKKPIENNEENTSWCCWKRKLTTQN